MRNSTVYTMSENVATLNKDLHLKQDEFWYGILGIWYSWTLLCGVESIRMTSQECAKNGSWTRVAVTYGGWCCTGNQPTELCFAFILIRGWSLYNIVMGVCHTATWTGHRCVCGSFCRARAHYEGQPWVWESHTEPVALFQEFSWQSSLTVGAGGQWEKTWTYTFRTSDGWTPSTDRDKHLLSPGTQSEKAVCWGLLAVLLQWLLMRVRGVAGGGRCFGYHWSLPALLVQLQDGLWWEFKSSAENRIPFFMVVPIHKGYY